MLKREKEICPIAQKEERTLRSERREEEGKEVPLSSPWFYLGHYDIRDPKRGVRGKSKGESRLLCPVLGLTSNIPATETPERRKREDRRESGSLVESLALPQT